MSEEELKDKEYIRSIADVIVGELAPKLEQIEELTPRLADIEGKISALQARLDHIDVDFSAAFEKQQDDVNKSKEESEKEINNLREFNKELFRQLREELKQLSEHVDSQYAQVEEKITAIGSRTTSTDETQIQLRTELQKTRDELHTESSDRFETVQNRIGELEHATTARIDALGFSIRERIEGDKKDIETRLTELSEKSGKELAVLQHDLQTTGGSLRKESSERSEATQKLVDDLSQNLQRQIDENKTELGTQVSELSKGLSELKVAIEQRFELISSQIVDEVAKLDQKHGETLNSARQAILTETSQTDEKLSKGLELVLGDTESHEQAISNLNKALSELVTEQIPKITESLLENRDEDFKALQRIFEGVTEGLRDEIILLRRLMVETEERWQRESTERFMAAIDRDRLMKRFEELEKSLRERGEGIRSELLTSLETTLERIREENLSTGQLTEALRTDFNHFREDSASLVERRVNDKFDFVLGLLDRLNKKTEQLAQAWTSAKSGFTATATVGKPRANEEEHAE